MKTSSFRCILLWILCIPWAGWAGVAVADCLFVNTNSPVNTVAAFHVEMDGSLSPVSGSPFFAGGLGGFRIDVGSLDVSAASSLLYVTNSISHQVGAFHVAPDCALSPVAGSPFEAGVFPTGIAIDPTDEHVYVANFGGHSISVYSIAPDGSLTEISGSPFATEITPLDIEFAEEGRRFFVSHDFLGSVGVYDQAHDGSFLPVAGSPFPAGGSEHGLVLNPSHSRLYTAGLGSRTIHGYSVESAGGLQPLVHSPYSTGVTPVELVIDPADSYLYVTENRDHTLSGFSIDPQGDLTPLPDSPFASDSQGPAGLAMDPAGRFLYVANGGLRGNPDVSVYVVLSDGSLAPIPGSPFATGGTGAATGIVYFSTATDSALVEVPVLGTFGTVCLTLTIACLGLLFIRRLFP